MKQLPLERVWTGDGRGQSDAVTHKQIKRTDKVALYSVTNKRGQLAGYEVFMVTIVEAGTPLPGGGQVEESYERYPSANQFGRIAWAPSSLAQAEKIYAGLLEGKKPCELTTEDNSKDCDEDTNDEPKAKREKKPLPTLTIPVMEFTIKELAEQNKVEYPIAFQTVKLWETENKVKFVREERRAAKGKPSKIFAKV